MEMKQQVTECLIKLKGKESIFTMTERLLIEVLANQAWGNSYGNFNKDSLQSKDVTEVIKHVCNRVWCQEA